jgi:hypothetical protein
MAERNVTEKLKPLPQKIEKRLAELAQMGEFDQGDVNHCRISYWSARDDWHKILIDCYDEAKRRTQHEPTQPTGDPA